MSPGDSEQFDAVVVGGGPAGSVAALALARRGWRVAVIEKRPVGRAKACGHCLGPRGVVVLERLGLAGAARGDRGDAAQPTRRLRVHVPGCDGGRPLDVVLDRAGRRPGVVVDRPVFDERLLAEAAAAGAEVIRPAAARVARLVRDAADVVVEGGRRLSAGLVVGADGLGSRVGREGGLAVESGRKAGFATDLDVSPGQGPEPGVIEMVIVPGGYLGAVRSGVDRVHVAGLIDLTHVRHWKPIQLLEAAAKALGIETRPSVQAERPWRLLGAAPMPWKAAAVAGPRVALVGDAAGYVEPFTGEGMGWALASAERLGQAVAGRPAGSWDASTARAYRRAWGRSIGSRQRTCRWVAAAVGRPRLLTALPGAVRSGLAGWLSARVMAP